MPNITQHHRIMPKRYPTSQYFTAQLLYTASPFHAIQNNYCTFALLHITLLNQTTPIPYKTVLYQTAPLLAKQNLTLQPLYTYFTEQNSTPHCNHIANTSTRITITLRYLTTQLLNLYSTAHYTCSASTSHNITPLHLTLQLHYLTIHLST